MTAASSSSPTRRRSRSRRRSSLHSSASSVASTPRGTRQRGGTRHPHRPRHRRATPTPWQTSRPSRHRPWRGHRRSRTDSDRRPRTDQRHRGGAEAGATEGSLCPAFTAGCSMLPLVQRWVAPCAATLARRQRQRQRQRHRQQHRHRWHLKTPRRRLSPHPHVEGRAAVKRPRQACRPARRPRTTLRPAGV